MSRFIASIWFALRFSVGTEHLILGLLGGTGPAADFLRERGINTNCVLAELQNLFARPHESA
jgi:hypothetical protein